MQTAGHVAIKEANEEQICPDVRVKGTASSRQCCENGCSYTWWSSGITKTKISFASRDERMCCISTWRVDRH